jgi:hypothetical protein
MNLAGHHKGRYCDIVLGIGNASFPLSNPVYYIAL